MLQDGNREVEEEIPRRGVEARGLQRDEIERILKKRVSSNNKTQSYNRTHIYN